MNVQPCYLILFVLLPLAQSATTCHSCASPSLKLNWEVTGLPTYPKNSTKFFKEDCLDRLDDTDKECPTASCFFGVYVLSSGEYTVVRGCVDDFVDNSNGGAPSIGNGQCEYAQSNKAVVISDKVYPRPYVGWIVCSNKDNCNNRQVNKDTANLAWDEVTSTIPCTILSSKTRCIECSHVDGRGRCHHDTKTSCTGAYCTKLNGKLNGRWFEIRGCSNINPLGVLTCTGYQKTMVIEQLAGTINQSYWANSCMCQGEICNVAASFSSFLPIITIAIAVFICTIL
ncbi:hypothetical protein M3Y95_00573900 [Aphelenchoides besseyi]|nr:hypothetical protein M3Y95_00573900 [Aphelenchoides besseyi]